jgi:hypothetical protein
MEAAISPRCDKKQKNERNARLADRQVPFFFLIWLDFFYGLIVRFSTRGAQKHHNIFYKIR